MGPELTLDDFGAKYGDAIFYAVFFIVMQDNLFQFGFYYDRPMPNL